MITYEDAVSTFVLDSKSKSGLVWAVDKYACNLQVAKIGEACGTLSANGYWEVKHERKTYKCHRIVYMLYNQISLKSSDKVDHIDGVKTNNTPSNLRLASASLNARNRQKRSDCTTGITGVSIYNDSRGNPYATAFWQGFCGKQKYKRFSVKKYGMDGAIELARTYRELKINELNKCGAGYSDRHGK